MVPIIIVFCNFLLSFFNNINNYIFNNYIFNNINNYIIFNIFNNINNYIFNNINNNINNYILKIPTT